MRALTVLLACALPALGAAAPQEDFDGVIRMGGSSTLLPVIADCANEFMEKYATWDKVDPSFPKKQILIFVTGGGSGFGVKAATSGAVHIGLCTRGLKDEEKAAIGAHEMVLVSKDCLAIVTSRESPFAAKGKDFSRADSARILTGEAKTWKDLDASLPASPIVVLLRDFVGSANELIQKEVLRDKVFTPGAIQLPSMGAILKKAEENANGFAFLSSGMANASEKLKIYSFEGVMPTNENVISGKYALSRPMQLLVKGKATPPERAFLNFLLGEGQKTFEAHGYIPIKAAEKK